LIGLIKLKKIYYILQEVYEDIGYKYWHQIFCDLGLHWPIVWSEDNGGYLNLGYEDPPEPPEPSFCCGYCGKIKDPYRAVFWRIKEKIYGN
jgi:hypothetical protein